MAHTHGRFTGFRFIAPLLAGLCAGVATSAEAQTSRSGPAAQGLATLLTERKLDAVATRDPEQADRFVAALFFPGQLLVVAGQYAAPSLLTEKLTNRKYRDVYADVYGAAVPDSKIFFQDLGADGLHAGGGQAIDLMYEKGVTQTIFDGAEPGLSAKAYQDKFTKADAQYQRLLSLLIQELKQTH
jgi:hypothetical protein